MLSCATPVYVTVYLEEGCCYCMLSEGATTDFSAACAVVVPVPVIVRWLIESYTVIAS